LIKAFSKQPNPEFILATRYGQGVEMDKDWPLHRQVISWGARLMSRPLTSASDPMSGFFGVRRDVFERAVKTKSLNVAGFKIALELLIKAHVPSTLIAEVPFSFGVRAHGESKLTGKVVVKYIEQLVALYRHQLGDVNLVLVILVALFVFLSILYRVAEHLPIVSGLLHK
jgi:dolichol-phosphate mannosyltransferase